MEPEQIVASGLCQCPEGRGIFSQLSVKENLLIGAFLRSDKGINDDIKSIYEMFPILEERANQVAGNLSGGEQMMLAIGRALMGRPALLMLDEPSLGLAPLAAEKNFSINQKNQQRRGHYSPCRTKCHYGVGVVTSSLCV